MPESLCSLSERFPVGTRVVRVDSGLRGVCVSASEKERQNVARYTARVGAAFARFGEQFVAVQWDGRPRIGSAIPSEVRPLDYAADAVYTQKQLTEACSEARKSERVLVLDEIARKLDALR